ncbi:hypothetical protein Trydic_g11864 [Trypoxylus dichotomus]
MPRGKLLTEEEQNRIRYYKGAGLSNRAIAKKLGRSHHLINNFTNLGDSYSKNRAKGNNQKLTPEQWSSIFRLATFENITAQQIKSYLNLPVTKRRVQQILSGSEDLPQVKKASKSPLLEEHKEGREKFQQDTEWKNIIFFDGKKFNLEGPDDCRCSGHNLNTEVVVSRNFGDGTVTVWASFTN